MKPALTAEEWDRVLDDVDDDDVTERDKAMARHIEIAVGAHDFARAAALCFHGQPFGLTREMVTALRDALACSGTVTSPDDLPLAERAVDNIEALLPPVAP